MVSELSTSKVIYLSCESFDEDLHPKGFFFFFEKQNLLEDHHGHLDAYLRQNFDGEEHIISLELQEFSHY